MTGQKLAHKEVLRHKYEVRLMASLAQPLYRLSSGLGALALDQWCQLGQRGVGSLQLDEDQLFRRLIPRRLAARGLRWQ